MKRNIILNAILLMGMLLFPPHASARAQSDLPVVHAVLFYSPTCGHCEFVITQTILPMTNQYGEQLQVIGIDISQQQGWDLFLEALQKFGLDRGGVPLLVFDNMYLMGSQDIPQRFPGMVETYLQQGGLDWPDLPGLSAILPAATEAVAGMPSPSNTVPPTSSSSETNSSPTFTRPEDLTWRDRFAHDPAGNTLAVIVLLGMFGSTAWAFNLFQKTNGYSLKERWNWTIPVLCVIGLGVAIYLAYVETAQVEAVCGPVGDCNTVQQSEYARLFGFLPIGVLGVMGYVFIVIAWGIARYSHGRPAGLAALSMLAMTAFGTLFSIYLTFLEPFVIGATCAWCLASAILMTILMLLSIGPAKLAFSTNLFAAPRPRRRKRIGARND